MDGRILAALLVAVFLLGVLALMALAWRRRVSRDARIGPLPELPDPRPVPSLTVEVLYVATSKHDQPLERLALEGLRYRSRVTLELGAAGVVVDVPGERPTFIPATSIVGLDQTNLTIDRVVEPGGLLRLSWRPVPSVIADSTFRVLEQADRARIIDAVTSIIPAADAGLRPTGTPDTVGEASSTDDRTPPPHERARP
ncbi:hypothetical protein ASF83_03500 [Plantibacter sp. Leaf171]|uniref:PH-like domain-containing protein n=1 Tax=unclassified Plantibacter TaxID=2624265 RepID=UPI0006F4F1D8|nr:MULTISPECIES: hypothetical protein [unclassified Plantibacter]KQM15089.1 hypothetical protein ASE44_03515 [Plantibacter sp. Leaf1]KQR58232.1 hypothetical protein ASF83_03500 [Plantibacter sp. Leaf171]